MNKIKSFISKLLKDYFNDKDKKELIEELKNKMSEGVVILIKGSQMMRMEQVVKDVMVEKEKTEDLLVRQDDFWLNKE